MIAIPPGECDTRQQENQRMNTYTITQSSKGGYETQRQRRQHENAVIERLLTDGYANQETCELVARFIREIKRDLRSKWGTEEAMRISAHLEELTPEEASEWCECAEWRYDAVFEERRRDWGNPELIEAMQRAVRWAATMRSMHSITRILKALRESSYQRVA